MLGLGTHSLFKILPKGMTGTIHVFRKGSKRNVTFPSLSGFLKTTPYYILEKQTELGVQNTEFSRWDFTWETQSGLWSELFFSPGTPQRTCLLQRQESTTALRTWGEESPSHVKGPSGLFYKSAASWNLSFFWSTSQKNLRNSSPQMQRSLTPSPLRTLPSAPMFLHTAHTWGFTW